MRTGPSTLSCWSWAPKRAGGRPGFRFGGLAVVDVEHRAQFVPVFGFKPARTEFNAVHHVGVGERQPFLLTAPHQEGRYTSMSLT